MCYINYHNNNIFVYYTIWHTAECWQVKYERMVAGYNRIWIKLQGSLAGRYITSYRQLRVKELPKVFRWQLEWDSNQRPSAPKAPNTTTQPPHPILCLMVPFFSFLQDSVLQDQALFFSENSVHWIVRDYWIRKLCHRIQTLGLGSRPLTVT